MNSRIAFSSVFGEYSGKENRVTAAFLHILDLGGEPLLRYVLGVANDEILSYLIDQFVLLLNNLQLYDEWENRVIVVGGSFREDVALKYGFYACQNNRFFRKAKNMAFAYDNHVRNLFDIVGGPFNDIDIQKEKNISQDYFVNKEPFYKSEKRELFWLKKVSVLNILNDTTDKNGRRLAFTQRRTYTTYDKITTATLTSEL